MKWLQCEHCKAGAYGGQTRRFPDGEPMVVGTISHFPHRFKCSRCLRVSTVTPTQWSLLPRMTQEEVVELGVLPSVVS